MNSGQAENQTNSSLHQRYYTESVHSSIVEYRDNWPADLYGQVRRTTVTPTRSASGILSGFGGSAWESSIQEIFCLAITNNVNDLCKRHHKVSSCWEYLEDEHVSSLWHRPDIHSIECLGIEESRKTVIVDLSPGRTPPTLPSPHRWSSIRGLRANPDPTTTNKNAWSISKNAPRCIQRWFRTGMDS